MTEQERDSVREQRRQERDRRKRMQWERHLARRTAHCQNMQHSNKSWMGIGVILVGIVWLINVLGVAMPDWLFTWPMLLVAIGVFTGLSSKFRNMGSFVLILIGLAFLARNFVWPDIDMGKYVWPVVLIFLGILFLVRRQQWDKKKEWFLNEHPEWKDWHEQWRHHHGHFPGQDKEQPAANATADLSESFATAEETGQEQHYGHQGEAYQSPSRVSPRFGAEAVKDWIDVTTIFGGARRTVISKNFKGGDIVNICGGTVVDLTHADLPETAVIDVVAIWGGVKIVVPPNWQVRLDVTHLMAGTDDRRGKSIQDPNKVLILTGTVLMAGIEITDTP